MFDSVLFTASFFSNSAVQQLSGTYGSYILNAEGRGRGVGGRGLGYNIIPFIPGQNVGYIEKSTWEVCI